MPFLYKKLFVFRFIRYQKKKENDIKILLKTIYDHGKQAEEKRRRDKALPELLIQDMDEEQIWQQIELQVRLAFILTKVSVIQVYLIVPE